MTADPAPTPHPPTSTDPAPSPRTAPEPVAMTGVVAARGSGGDKADPGRGSGGGWRGSSPGGEAARAGHVESDPRGKRLATLTLMALGVVYGDIGTSPLYAIRECFKPEYGLTPNADNVYGILSLILWSLIAVVSVKYIVYIMRADNRGEGGILALLALVMQRDGGRGIGASRAGSEAGGSGSGGSPGVTPRDTTPAGSATAISGHAPGTRRRMILIMIGLFGAALLYGDGVITPAISVLGAVEGLQVAAPTLAHWTVILAVVILLLLFLLQQKGTAHVGGIFGPAMLVWFGTIATLGMAEIVREPRILLAMNPWYGVRLFLAHGSHAFLLLGAVVLAVTGAEALYADMGHFGKRPIRLAWFGLVLPALLINYFGQGAILLRQPNAAQNPFYYLAPRPFLFPLIVIATVAAVIASQALISGAFSLTQQSVQLGYSPRVTIKHTSRHEVGQIYIPEVNAALMVGCLWVVIGFGSSDKLGAAYGIAVTGTMAITTALFYVVARSRWHWSKLHAGVLATIFMSIDLAFFFANATKIAQGGWVPLVIAVGIFTLMTTWKKGRNILRDKLRESSLPLHLLLESLDREKPVRVRGTAVFMTSDPEGAPVVLLHHLKHNKVLHEQVILLSIMTADVPEIPYAERLTVEMLSHGFVRVQSWYGFMETPDVRDIMARCEALGVRARPQETTYYLGREQLITTGSAKMPRWRKRLFSFMSRNARSATQFFGIPPNRVVELGAQIEL